MNSKAPSEGLFLLEKEHRFFMILMIYAAFNFAQAENVMVS